MLIVKTDAAFVAFGELLLRLTAPGAETLLQSPAFKVCVGGAEANVAVAMAQLDHQARVVSVLPDNDLGRAARDELRRHGVDVSGIQFVPGRMGLYFLTPGAIRRSPDVLYDRAGSAISVAAPDAIDWTPAFEGAGWFHVSGITAAVGQNAADAALRAAKAAKAAGLTVSFDCNYRSKLWEAWNGDGPAILRQLLAEADVLFGDHRDIALILGLRFAEDSEIARRAAAEAVFQHFPGITRMACTHRVQHSVDHHDMTGHLFSPEGFWTTSSLPLTPIVDRIGGGDAFAAGIIHGLMKDWSGQRTVDFGVAAAGLKHAMPGDISLATEAEILAALSAEGLDVRR
jgi:2-dehydro-3-deoxygluconokinase